MINRQLSSEFQSYIDRHLPFRVILNMIGNHFEKLTILSRIISQESNRRYFVPSNLDAIAHKIRSIDISFLDSQIEPIYMVSTSILFDSEALMDILSTMSPKKAFKFLDYFVRLVTKKGRLEPKAFDLIKTLIRKHQHVYTELLFKDPSFRAFITKQFPIKDPCSAIFYPVVITARREKYVNIETLEQVPRYKSEEMFIALSDFLFANHKPFSLEDTYVNYVDTPGIDSGGLSRDMFIKVLIGIMNSKMGELRFNLTETKREKGFLPELISYDSRSVVHLYTLGKIFMMFLKSSGSYTTGGIFFSGLFKTIWMLSDEEVANHPLDFVRRLNLYPQRMLELYRPLLDDREIKSFESFQVVLFSTVQKEIDIALRYFVEIGLLRESQTSNLDICISEVTIALRENYLCKLRACQAIAHGMKNCIPTSFLKLDIKTFVCHNVSLTNWNDFKRCMQEDEFIILLQGLLDKTSVKDFIVVEGVDHDKSILVKLWIDKWIDRQPDDLSTIKLFLQNLTGNQTLLSWINVYIIDEVSAISTCLFTLKLPEDITEEMLNVQMNALGDGIGLEITTT